MPGREVFDRIAEVWPLVQVDTGGSAPAEALRVSRRVR